MGLNKHCCMVSTLQSTPNGWTESTSVNSDVLLSYLQRHTACSHHPTVVHSMWFFGPPHQMPVLRYRPAMHATPSSWLIEGTARSSKRQRTLHQLGHQAS